MRNCPACQRPVRDKDGACPFCATSVPPAGGATLGRYVIGAAIAAAAAGGAIAADAMAARTKPRSPATPTASPSPRWVQPPYGAAMPPSRPPGEHSLELVSPTLRPAATPTPSPTPDPAQP